MSLIVNFADGEANILPNKSYYNLNWQIHIAI